MTTVPNSSIKLDNKVFSFQGITLMLWSFAVLSYQLPRAVHAPPSHSRHPCRAWKLPALQRKVLEHPCSGTALCGHSSPTDSHEVERTCGLVFSRPMKRLPAQHFPSDSLPAGTLLPEHHTHLHTQHLAPWPPAPRENPLSVSSFQPYFGLWARSRLLVCTKLFCLQFYVLWCK